MTKILLISLLFATCSKTVPIPKMDYLSPSKTCIDLPANYNYSGRFLFKWLNVIAGTEQVHNVYFSVNSYDTVGKMIISIGNTKLNSGITVTGNASYVIKKSGNLISIKGADSYGDFAGVNYFLDHYCGVRFYLPGDMFTSRQQSDSIFVPDSIYVTGKPDIPNVNLTGLNYKAYGSGNDLSQWDLYWSYIVGLNRNFITEHQHTMSERFFDSVVFMNYVRIFSNGYFPVNASDPNFTPDFAEPTLVDAAEYVSIKYFKANPSSQSIAFSVMDGPFTIGPATKLFASTYNDPRTGYSNANAIFLNNLAARLRADSLGNKTIVFLSYSGVNYPPLIKLDSMILPVVVYHIGNMPDSSLNIKTANRVAWGNVTKRFGEHDWAQGMGYIYPRIYTSNVQRFCKLYSPIGLDFYDLEAYPNWALDGLKLYEMSKIFWNINVNTDSVRTQFCNDMFGKSAQEMNLYFTTLESLNNTILSQSHLYNYKEQLAGTDSVNMQMLRNHLNNALLLDTSQIVQDRIIFFNTGFKIYEGAWNVHNGGGTDNYAAFLKSIAGRGDMYFLAGDSATFINNIPNFIKSLK